jgi:hypothetical protein
MQRQMTWKNWPFLLAGILIVAGLLVLSSVFKNSHVISNYLADLGGAISAIILSIATYDEYERRRQRKRYLPPERMGARRIQDEVYQLMFQYAFVVNLRYNPKSPSRQAVDKTAAASDSPSRKQSCTLKPPSIFRWKIPKLSPICSTIPAKL